MEFLKRGIFRNTALIGCVSFLLNLIWEFAQMPLYREGSLPFSVHAPMCVWATVWDAGYTIVLYLLLSALFRNIDWIRDLSLAKSSVVFGTGFVVAAYVELRALRLDKWAYAPAMPLLPVLGVGLTPFLQLALLSLATYYIVARIPSKPPHQRITPAAF